jgi:hypothetical protein
MTTIKINSIIFLVGGDEFDPESEESILPKGREQPLAAATFF